MSKVKIVAAVVDTTEITLYQETGETITILQGDPRVPTIVDQVLPIVEKGGVAEVDLSTVTHYGEFEELVQGAIQFFRVAKTVLERVLTRQDIPAGQFGPVPKLSTDTQRAVSEIIANAKPTSSDEFHASDLGSDETIVAVVDTDEGQVAIPGAEKLEDLFAYSAKNRNTIGVQNLMKRMAKMQGKRGHTVEDLLRFLEKADMPISDDGSIIAYKILRHSSRSDDTFVDCHTKRVLQKVGSYVCMAENMVDPNRRNECSNGLHVARRGYVGGFGGDVVTLIKVAPEDVIAVPNYDANKVRVCGYHILAKLPDNAYSKLKSNRPMTDDPQIARLLAQVLKGNHIDRLEEVRITEQNGHGVIVTPLVNGKLPKATKKTVTKGTSDKKAPQARALDDPKEKTRSVDPKEVANKVVSKSKAAAKATPAPARSAASKAKPSSTPLPAPKAAPVAGTRQEKAAALLQVINSTAPASERGLAAVNLMNLKRTSKVSYEKLGVTISEDDLKKIAHAGESAAAEAQEKAAKRAAKPHSKPPEKVTPVPVGSRQEVARQLFKAKDWPGLKTHKQKTKVSWEALGFTESEIATIKSKI